MSEIGGYFELELPLPGEYPHQDAIHLNSGRHALEYILCCMDELPQSIWIPHFTCDVITQPLNRLGITIKHYDVSETLEIRELPKLQKDEIIIVNNYFGIKDQYVDNICRILGNSIIVDNSQAFYSPEIPGIRMFYSPRKFLGMPDGGLAITPDDKMISLESDYSYSRCSHLLKRIDRGASSGYEDFHTNSSILSRSPMLKMSNLSERILASVDHERIRDQRISNYQYLQSELDRLNHFKTIDNTEFSCPMVYPYLTDDDTLRKRLIDNKIFVATYWPNVINSCKDSSYEYKLAKYLLPLPIDQRYTPVDLEIIAKIIKDR